MQYNKYKHDLSGNAVGYERMNHVIGEKPFSYFFCCFGGGRDDGGGAFTSRFTTFSKTPSALSPNCFPDLRIFSLLLFRIDCFGAVEKERACFCC